ncbi:MAG: DUF4234 domain-containing protein [Oscillospiraceae bacterium]|jgi:hypothetical protein|nr:DUF4234 domain-containing protein [Oscillospiraceae bacterium]
MFVGQKQDPVKLVLLSIVTCGIYYLYWLYKVGEEVNQALGKEAVKTSLVWISIICAPISLYYLYTLDLALGELAQQRGLQWTSNFLIWVLLSVFAGIGSFIAMFQVQTFLNQVWDQYAPPPPPYVQ